MGVLRFKCELILGAYNKNGCEANHNDHWWSYERPNV